jgi:hypothetical protein
VTEPTSRHDILEAAVARLAEASDLPAFANQVEELLAVTQDEQASLWQLTEVILKNVSLTTKVLRTVNSVAYNRSGTRILSVSPAVRLMGVNAVRHLATSILLFDHFKARGSGVGRVIGCFYFDRHSGPLGLDSAGREAILGLRDRAGRALEKLRRK